MAEAQYALTVKGALELIKRFREEYPTTDFYSTGHDLERAKGFLEAIELFKPIINKIKEIKQGFLDPGIAIGLADESLSLWIGIMGAESIDNQ